MQPVSRQLLCLLSWILATFAFGTCESATGGREDPTIATSYMREWLISRSSSSVLAPKSNEQPRLTVWVHRGTSRAGSKVDKPLECLVKFGYAVASVDFRLSTEAKSPAQMHDIKASIRFLTGSAERFGYSAEDILIAGGSAGGHLALLAAVTAGSEQLEGGLGEHLDESSTMQACIPYCGMSNLTTIL